MGRRRAQQIMARLARQFPDQHKLLMREVERIEREVRRGGDATWLPDRCRALLQEANSHRLLLPFLAQGCPSYLSTLLSRVGGCCGYEDADGAVLQLASAMAVSGARADTLMDGISKNFASCVALVFVDNTAVARLALSLFGWAVQLASDGERIASRLLCDDEFWRRLDSLWFSDGMCISSSLLTAFLGLVRASCSVTSTARGAVVSRLKRLCTLASVRDDVCVKDEVLQLLIVLRLTQTELDRGVDECLAMLTSLPTVDVSQEGNVTQTFSAALATGGDEVPVAALSAALDSLQRDQFDSAARVKDLDAIARLLFHSHAPSGMAAALLVLLPGALKAVFAAASGVDENVSACACTILACAIGGQEWAAPNSGKQTKREARKHYKGFDAFYYKNCLVEHFFLLGGVVLLEDLLTDYSNSVVVGALQLLQSLIRFSDEGRDVILASKCIEIICEVMQDMSQDSNISLLVNGTEGESALLLVLKTITFLGGDAMRLLPESTLGCIGTIATEARTNAKVLEAAVSALTLLAEAYPLAATLVLDYEYMNTVLALGENSSLSELDAVYLIGSLNIMAVIVARLPSSVTFEWIEIIVLASRRLQAWEESVPGYARAFWNTLLETVTASEDGGAYLFEDEGFIRLLCASLTRCCQIYLLKKEECHFDEEVKGDTGDTKKNNEALNLLPLLVRVTRHEPKTEPRRLPLKECDILEAIAFLIVASQDAASSDLLLELGLVLMTDDELCSSVLDVIAQAGPSVVPVLLRRMELFFASTSESAPGTESVNSWEDFSAALAVLSGILERSEASHTRATLEAVAGLLMAALRFLDKSPLPFSLYAGLLSLLYKMLHLEDAVVKEVACHLWIKERLVELLSPLLCLLRGNGEERKLCGLVYDVVHRLYDAQTVSSLPFILQEKSFLLFATKHVLRDCEHPSCRLLLMRLSTAADFRRYMSETHGELYRAALKNVSADDGGENSKVLYTSLLQCSDAKAEEENMKTLEDCSGVAWDRR
ncbi:hypothetical protein TcG_08534 [Trypanosoma cruzi]|nr:hypothetical protein TcG_08534 [Trypanosoma cruzi]